jgi:hypothetical protein
VRPIRCGSRTVALGSQENVLPDRIGVEGTRETIAILGYTVTNVRDPIAVARGLLPRRGGLVTEP